MSETEKIVVIDQLGYLGILQQVSLSNSQDEKFLAAVGESIL